MRSDMKAKLLKIYIGSYILCFISLIIQDYGHEKWLWSSFIFATLFSPFSFLLGVVFVGVLQDPSERIFGKLKKMFKK